MKQFFKFMFASMLGVFLSFLLLFFFLLFIISGIVSRQDEHETVVDNNSVLELTFDHPINERTSRNPLDGLQLPSFKSDQDLGLNDILKNIEKAKTDEHIRGIFLNLSSIRAGISTV